MFITLVFTLALSSPQSAASIKQTNARVPQQQFSVMFSPLSLALMFGDFSGEYRLGDKLGIAAHVGGGAMFLRKSDPENDKDTKIYGAWKTGASLRYYIAGTFTHGMQLGVKTYYLNLRGNADNEPFSQHEISVGPFLGYKFASQSGFTLEFQVGPKYVEIWGDTPRALPPISWNGFSPDASIKLGWSF
jgi:hypothetical protein